MRPYYLLPRTEAIALSDKTGAISYREFVNRIHEINAWYRSLGYGPGHRISVVGKNSVETYLYLFAAALDMTATTLARHATPEEDQFRLDTNNSNAVIRIEKGDVTVEHRHFGRSQELENEVMLYYTSGSTGLSKCYSTVYELDQNNWGTSQDVTHYYRNVGNPWYRNPSTNRTINAMHPHIGWGQEVTFSTIAAHGHVHLLDEPEEYDDAAEWVKPTWLAGFPLAWQRVIDVNEGTHNVHVFEYSGAALVDGQKEKFEQFFGHRNWICGYGDAATGMTFANYSNNFDHIGKPIQCLTDSGAEFKIGDNGTIEFRGLMTPDQDWWDTGDLARVDRSGNYYLLGRANELIIIRGGGKVYPFEVESQLAAHDSVQEVWVYPQPDDGLHFVPACVYYGDLSPAEYAEFTHPLMAKYKQPVRYVKLTAPTSKLQTSANISKISRLKLHKLLEQNPSWIEDEYIR